MLFKKLYSKNIKTIKEDNFIKRLRCSVIGEGMLNEGNIYLFDYAIKNLPTKGSVVEIGSYGGLSTNLICYLLAKYTKQNVLYTCDAWRYEGFEDTSAQSSNFMDGRPDITRIEYMNYIKQAFINATLILSKNNLPHTIHSTSELFFEKWKNKENTVDVFGRNCSLGGEIAFAYIDGDHSEKAAFADFLNVDAYLVKGGYILLDDSADNYRYGSSKMMDVIKKNNNYSVVLKNPNYLIQKTS